MTLPKGSRLKCQVYFYIQIRPPLDINPWLLPSRHHTPAHQQPGHSPPPHRAVRAPDRPGADLLRVLGRLPPSAHGQRQERAAQLSGVLSMQQFFGVFVRYIIKI